MKKAWGIGIVVLLAAGLGGTSPAAAQGELDRLESGIRTSNGPPVMTAAAPQRVYLGAFADNDAGRGVRVLSVRSGGPADRAGLQPQDLIVAAAGRKIRLAERTLGHSQRPQSGRPLVAGVGPRKSAAADRSRLGRLRARHNWASRRTASGRPRRRTNGIDPAATGRACRLRRRRRGRHSVVPNPQPVPANSPQAQIEELRRRVDQLERRVQELERALAESQRK